MSNLERFKKFAALVNNKENDNELAALDLLIEITDIGVRVLMEAGRLTPDSTMRDLVRTMSESKIFVQVVIH